MIYRCPVCGSVGDEEVCPVCHTPRQPYGDPDDPETARRQQAGEAAKGAAAPSYPQRVESPVAGPSPSQNRSGAGERAGAEEAGVPPRAASSRPEAFSREQPQDPPPGAERPRASTAADRDSAAGPGRERREAPLGSDLVPQLAGEKKLEKYVEDGYEVFLIVGIARAGKTELLGAFPQDGYLDRFQRQENKMVIRTAPTVLETYSFSASGRSIVFADTSGERFRFLYPHERDTGQIAPSDVQFLRTIARRLRGLILLIDLERLWGERYWAEYPPNAKQVEILQWIVALLRWLTFGGKYDPESPISFQEQVNAAVQKMPERLRVPVLILFSKADRLVDFTIPALKSAAWLRRGTADQRRLDPKREQAFFFAYHCLRRLVTAVETHADYFRFDFVHSLVTDTASKSVVEERSCGVSTALSWLLDPCWQRRHNIPTRRWIAFQRVFDRALGRGGRWNRLPAPREIRT